MSDYRTEKNQLRRLILERRDGTSADYLMLAADAIAERVYRSDEFAGATDVGLYWSVGSEIPTHDMITCILERDKRKRLFLPRVTGGLTMEFRRIRSSDELIRGAYNIMEPPVDSAVCESLDMVLVPSVAVSLDGIRLGYGLGYYDRFFEGCDDGPAGPAAQTASTGAVRVALALEKQLVRRIPAEQHDARMDIVITEDRVVRTAVGSDLAA